MPKRDLITPDNAEFDQDRAEAAVRELLLAVGEDPDRQGLKDTPARVARAYREMFAGLYTDPDAVLETTFDEEHDELVLVTKIPMYSTCEHHLVAFHGMAHVGYIPGVTTGSRRYIPHSRQALTKAPILVPRSSSIYAGSGWSTCTPSARRYRSD